MSGAESDMAWPATVMFIVFVLAVLGLFWIASKHRDR